jgi:L-ribulose-5-phosphate 3-epimerase
MFLGYNTNGFAHHRLDDAIAILAELGYRGIALTPDVNHLVTPNTNLRGLRSVIETGSRFLLDPRRKHQPVLISPEERERRLRFNFLHECIDLAASLNAECVSYWSGTATDDASHSQLMSRLVEQCKGLADLAAAKGVRLAFEPEPGMFIDTMEKFAELHAKVNHPVFGLTLDLGHLVCQGELPISRHIAAWKHVLWNVHIEDMKRGVHDHVMFGEGELDFDDAFAGLRAANYTGGLYVELSRHSYDAVNTARRAKAFLDRFMPE